VLPLEDIAGAVLERLSMAGASLNRV
jgi:hypothetical protein